MVGVGGVYCAVSTLRAHLPYTSSAPSSVQTRCAVRRHSQSFRVVVRASHTPCRGLLHGALLCSRIQPFNSLCWAEWPPCTLRRRRKQRHAKEWFPAGNHEHWQWKLASTSSIQPARCTLCNGREADADTDCNTAQQAGLSPGERGRGHLANGDQQWLPGREETQEEAEAATTRSYQRPQLFCLLQGLAIQQSRWRRRTLDLFIAAVWAGAVGPLADIAAAGDAQPADKFQWDAQDPTVEGQQAPDQAQKLFKLAKDKFQALYDKVYYGDVLPPVGSHVMSYSRFLELLYKKRIKRIYLMADGQVALVEIPSPGWASDYDTEIRSKDAPEVPCFQQRAEWDQEKVRYYVELPGDVWDDGMFMSIIKEHQPVRPVNLEAKKMNLLQDNECTPELMVIDPGNANAFLSTYAPQFVPIIGLLALRAVLGGSEWILKKLGRERKSDMQEAAEQFTQFKGKEYNIDEKGKPNLSTGVSYKDVAGIDNILSDIQEVMEMLLGSDKYAAAGAKPPRGILLEGPPGTGKTYLARAMAGEHGVPFFSANGAEFVEMFQGTAAARIRNLFARARKRAPAIVFIDEIDALGRKRGNGPSDAGIQEREAGLLQLLFEMDGFAVGDKVLIIGATNRLDTLDSALIRPGRFDRIIYMGRPTATNRKKILQVHVGNKPLSRENDDELLGQIAQLAVGFSGAELANLLNEAAILAVRKSRSEIDFPLLLEAMEKVKVGLPQPKLPDGEAKTRQATVQAGRAVAFALTPGLPPIKQVSIRPRNNTTTSILYVPQEFGKFGDMWHTLTAGQRRVNAVDPQQQILSTFDLCTGLLVPLYAARATEETFYGKGGATLSTSREISRAGDLARFLVVGSTLHPYFRDTPVLYAMSMGGELDPTTQDMEDVFEPLVAQMLDAAYHKALRLVQERRDAIEQVAQEMLNDKENEMITGERLVEIMDSTPLVPVLPFSSNGAANAADSAAARGKQPMVAPVGPAPTAGQVSFRSTDVNGSQMGGVLFLRTAAPQSPVSSSNGGAPIDLQEVLNESDLQSALQVLMGQTDAVELAGSQRMASKVQQVRKQLLESPGALQRLQEIKQFASSNNGSSFPSAPPLANERQPAVELEQWASLPDTVEY